MPLERCSRGKSVHLINLNSFPGRVKHVFESQKIGRYRFISGWNDCTLPLFLIVVILIKLDSEGPVFFKQKRVGKNKTHFDILKFRTMRIDTPKDTPTHLLENPDQYITRVGKFLRKTSLDELPQIWNIFAGDMSIIGP